MVFIEEISADFKQSFYGEVVLNLTLRRPTAIFIYITAAHNC